MRHAVNIADPYPDPVDVTVRGEVWEWRGPAPYHFVTVDDAAADLMREMAAEVSYGWGMIPVECSIGKTRFTTSLWPKDGRYVVPLKDAVRAAETIELGDVVTVSMRIGQRRTPTRTC